MGNPFYNKFGPQPNGLFQKFQEFKSHFQGNPEEEVQNLLNSGKMSQEQFNYLSALATQFQNMFGKK